MIALTSNPVDWVLALAFGVPAIIFAVAHAVDRCDCEHCTKKATR